MPFYLSRRIDEEVVCGCACIKCSELGEADTFRATFLGISPCGCPTDGGFHADSLSINGSYEIPWIGEGHWSAEIGTIIIKPCEEDDTVYDGPMTVDIFCTFGGGVSILVYVGSPSSVIVFSTELECAYGSGNSLITEEDCSGFLGLNLPIAYGGSVELAAT